MRKIRVERSVRGTEKWKFSMITKKHIMWLNFRLSSTAGERQSTPVESLAELYLFSGFLLWVFRDTTINIHPVNPAILWPLTFLLQLTDYLLRFLLLGPIHTLHLFNFTILSVQNLRKEREIVFKHTLRIFSFFNCSYPAYLNSWSFLLSPVTIKAIDNFYCKV